MKMSEWAKREVEIACKKEKSDRKEGEWDYGCACYESALKAFESLCEDGHSGFSFSLTKQILIRLMENKPLTPIEDNDDVWKKSFVRKETGSTVYQCKRMSSLFKEVYPDGKVVYDDIEQSYCVNIDNPDISYTSGLVRKIIGETFPITMPYNPPTKSIKVFCEDFLTNRKNGDLDTVGVFYAIDTNGNEVEINRFFDGSREGWKEIDKDEYDKRKLMAEKRIKEELENEISQHN